MHYLNYFLMFVLCSQIAFAQDKKSPAVAAKSGGITVPKDHAAVLFGVLKDVKYKLGGEEKWNSATKQTPLKLESEVRTAKGKAKIKLIGQGDTLLPLFSHVKLEKSDDNRLVLFLKRGKMWNNLAAKHSGNYIVRTPHLAAGKRGQNLLYNVAVDEKEGTRIAVFKGELSFQNKGKTITVAANQSVVVKPDGTVNPPQPVDPKELKEYTDWDQWEVDTYAEIGTVSVFGAKAIKNLIKTHSIDMQRAEGHLAEWKAGKTDEKVDKQVMRYKNAFLQFHRDTAHEPSEAEGFSVLVKNIGKWPNWKGPYVKGPVPPIDQFGQPLRYTKIKTKGGTEIMIVVSCGRDKRYSKGRVDDFVQYLKYPKK